MFDLHLLGDPVYSDFSMAPPKAQAQPAPQAGGNAGAGAGAGGGGPMSLAAMLAQINSIHPLTGGFDELTDLATDQSRNGSGIKLTNDGSNIGLSGTLGGLPTMGPDGAANPGWSDTLQASQYQQIMQILNRPLAGGGGAGVSSSTSPSGQNASLGQTL